MTEEAKRLVELLRDEDNCNVLDYIDDAADLIESLSATLEQVTKERDALLNELRGECNLCTHWQECLSGVYSGVRVDDSCWEWKGVEVE